MPDKETIKSDEVVIEEAFVRLDEIAKALEDPKMSLKDSLSYYAEGVKLISACRENLCGVEKELMILNNEL